VGGDGSFVVAGAAGDVQRASTEVELDGLSRPVRDGEVGPDRVEVGGDDGGGWATVELVVAGDVVGVRVGVRHDQLVRAARVVGQPAVEQCVHSGAQGELVVISGRAGIQQQRSVIAAKQVQERCFVVNGLVLPKNEGVCVVGMHL